jgi:hypothetical protein
VLFIAGYAESAAVGNGLPDEGMAVVTKPFETPLPSSRVRPSSPLVRRRP